MKYNLATHSQTTSVGDISLTTDEIIRVISTLAAQISVPSSGTTSGTLTLECDLGTRVHVGEVRYFHDGVDSMDTTASGITFSFKNESFETYTVLNTYYTDNYYYTIVSGTSAPRYIRMSHYVTGSGIVNGFQVLNDEDYVDFGTDGNDTDHNFYLSVEDNVTDISELYVYNSGLIKANAKLIIEPQHTVADDILSISDSEEGPWYGIYREEDIVAGTALWDTGTFDNTQELSSTLVLTGGQTVGTYTTRIFELEDNQRLTFAVLDNNYPIVTPEIEFFDDFSTGGTNWDWSITGDGIISFSSNNIHFYDPNSAGIINIWTESSSYEYTEDWDLTFRYIFVQHQATGDWGQFTYFMWPKADFYIRNYTNLGNNWTDVHLNGTNYSLSSKWNWPDYEGVWLNVRVKRNFTDLSFKIWESSGSEPASWDLEWTIQAGTLDVPTEGGIKIRSQYPWVGRHMYYDNFSLIKHYSASAGGKSIIAVEDIDTLENIEVRSSNSRPMDRETYIYLSGSSESTQYTNHYWIADGSFAEQSPDWGSWGYSTTYWECWYDSIREDEYWIDKRVRTPTSGSYNQCYFRIRRKNGSVVSVRIYHSYYFATTVNFNAYRIVFDQSGGFWVYYYIEITDYSAQNIAAQYRLEHYNSSMSRTYRKTVLVPLSTFLYDMDAVYESSGDVWYTSRTNSTVYKLNSVGDIIASYIAVDEVSGIIALDDGGCWFIQQTALLRLQINDAGQAELIDQLELPTGTISYIYSDKNGGFWAQDGETIRHLNPDATENFNVTIPNLYWITVVDSGVITKQHDGSTGTKPTASYINKYYKGIVRTWNYTVTEGGWKGTWDYNRFGARSQTYDDLVDEHASNFPIAIDADWNTFAPWAKVSLRDYTFDSEQYHQLRLTLRADNSDNSPIVYGVYTQRAIEIPDVYPDRYGTFYLKTDVSSLNTADVGDYTSDVRAYWFLSAE